MWREYVLGGVRSDVRYFFVVASVITGSGSESGLANEQMMLRYPFSFLSFWIVGQWRIVRDGLGERGTAFLILPNKSDN